MPSIVARITWAPREQIDLDFRGGSWGLLPCGVLRTALPPLPRDGEHEEGARTNLSACTDALKRGPIMPTLFCRSDGKS